MTKPTIRIRVSCPADASALQELYSQRSAYANTLQLPHPSLAHWQKKLSSDESPYRFVACLENEIVGDICLITSPPGRRCHVANIGMAVSESCRRIGVGSALLLSVIDLAEQWLSIRRIELEVFADNAPAIALYERHGFVSEGIARAYAVRDGIYVDVLRMARITL